MKQILVSWLQSL